MIGARSEVSQSAHSVLWMIYIFVYMRIKRAEVAKDRHRITVAMYKM